MGILTRNFQLFYDCYENIGGNRLTKEPYYSKLSYINTDMVKKHNIYEMKRDSIQKVKAAVEEEKKIGIAKRQSFHI